MSLSDGNLQHDKALTVCGLLAVLGLCALGSGEISHAQEAEVAPAVGLHAQATLTAQRGAPDGAGVIEMPLELAIKNGWGRDQSIRLRSQQCEIWLPACSQSPMSEQVLSEGAVKADPSQELLRVHFLFHGDAPTAVEVQMAGAEKLTVTAPGGGVSHHELLQRWWDAFNEQEIGNAPAVRELTDDSLSIIGAYLGMSPKPRQALKKEAASELEKQFERTLGMLLGFESVRLAMMTDASAEGLENAPAIHALPAAVNVIGQRIPDWNRGASHVERVAALVPNDCFYLRCGSINNYMWLRRFLIGWGGSLDDIVTNPTLKSDVRSRIEDQLGISATALLDADILVSDMAIIGSDVFFAEGAGVGVLLEAKSGDEQKLEAFIQQQRLEKAKQFSAMQSSETREQHSVSFFGTADNRMRSFMVRRGSYLLVTNSQAMVSAVISPESATRSLANLSEYRYAVATNQGSNQAGISLYLSDPFIRRLASPAYRIELGRRRQSAKMCRQLEVAAMIARAFGQQASSKQVLIKEKFLAASFGFQPDGSQIELNGEGAIDTMRGKAGTFIPAADLSITKANASELGAYYNFAQRYRAEWPAMDPVLVRIASTEVNDAVDRVKLQIHITPYARNEYGFLTRYLAEPTQSHAVLTQGELLGISALLRTQSRTIRAHIGVKDVEIPFRIQHGDLQRADGSQQSFVQQQSFAAVTPKGTEGLQVIAGLMESLQNRKVHDIPSRAASSSTAFSMATPLFKPFRSGSVPSSTDLMLASSEFLVRGLVGLAKASSLSEDGEWSIYGGDPQLREQVRNGLAVQDVGQPSQLLLRVAGIEHAAIAPYLNAYSYCESRKLSASITSWLDRWSTGLRTDPEFFRTSVEHTLHGSLTCPLGGDLELAKPAMVWRSTKWEEDSLTSVDHVPDGYCFPFLQWLKAVELSFNLTNTSLNSDVILQVARTTDGSPARIRLRSLGDRFDNKLDNRQGAVVPRQAGAPEMALNSGASLELRLGLSVKAPQALTNVTFSSSGTQVLVGGFSGTARLLDTKTLKEHQVLKGHENVIWTLALSKDGATAVTGSEDRTLRFWNTRSAKELAKIEAAGIFSCVRFAPDGRFVYATNWDGKVRIIDTRDFSVASVIDCGQPTLDVAVFADRVHFLVGTPSGDVLLYNSATQQVARRYAGHNATVHSIALVSDGASFLSASHDGTLRLWNVATGAATNIYRGHTAAVHEVRLAPDQKHFASGGADGTVRWWNLNESTPLATSIVGNDVRGISIAPNGSSIAAVCMDGTMRILMLPSRR